MFGFAAYAAGARTNIASKTIVARNELAIFITPGSLRRDHRLPALQGEQLRTHPSSVRRFRLRVDGFRLSRLVRLGRFFGGFVRLVQVAILEGLGRILEL